MRVLAPLLAAALTACATSPSADALAQKTALARDRLVAAIARGDTAAAHRLIAHDVSVHLLSGDSMRGEGARSLVRHFAASSGDWRLTMLRTEGAYQCTGLVQEYGSYALERIAPAESAYSSVARFRLLWTMTDAAEPQLWRAEFTRPGGRSYRVPQCRAVADSTFEAAPLRIAVHAMPYASDWMVNVTRALADAGWLRRELARFGAESRENYENSLWPTLTGEVNLRGPFVVGGVVTGLHGVARLRTDQRQPANLDFNGTVVAITGGVDTRVLTFTPGFTLLLSFNAGPAMLALNGVWTSPDDSGLFTAAADSSWSSTSLGVTSDAGVVYPVTSRLGATVRAQHRYFAKSRIPEYLGTEPTQVRLTHWIVLAGIEVTF